MLFNLLKKPKKHPNINIEFLINYDENKKFYLNGKFLFDEKTFKKYEPMIAFHISYLLDKFSNDFNIKNFKIDPNFHFHTSDKNHFGFRMNLFSENEDFLSVLPSIYFDLSDSEMKKIFLKSFVNYLEKCNFSRRNLIVDIFTYQKIGFFQNHLYYHPFVVDFIEKYNEFLNINTFKISYEIERYRSSYYISININNELYSIYKKALSEKTDIEFIKLLFDMKIIKLPLEHLNESEISEFLRMNSLLTY